MNRRERMLQSLDDDIRDHIERETQDNIDRGMPPEEARYAAIRRFGNVTNIKEETRDVWSLVWLEQLLQDVRFGLRMLRRNPGFTFVAVLTLALGIGANTAIFSVVYAVLLKPLPYTQPEQLLTVTQARPEDGIKGTGWSYANLVELRDHNHVFSGVVGTQQHQLTLTGRGDPSVVNTSVATPDLFSVFEQKPLLGRTFLPEDGKVGSAPMAVLSEGLWRTKFAADPNIVGTSINLDKRSYTIIGVMPAQFRFPRVSESNQLWIPLVHDPLFGPWMPRRGGHWLQVTARMRPGVTMAQAQAEMDTLSASLASEFPAENGGWEIRMMPLQEAIVGRVRTALFVLLGAVGLVLLIACANIANLLLTRATSRTREIAIRTTLGAGRTRIIRQLLSETAVLGLLGGITGIVIAYAGVHALNSLLPANLPRVNAIRVDTSVLLFALVLSTLASFVFGLTPALFAANSNLQGSLREGGSRSSESRTRRRARSVLASAEVALAMVLLVAAGLLLRSFSKLLSVNPGFDPQQIVKAEISLPQFQYSTPQQWVAFSDELLRRLQSQPGMRDAALAIPIPIADGMVNLGFDIVGAPPLAPGASRTANYASVSSDYFRVMSIPLMTGRFFSEHDNMSSPRVCLISQALARQYFPHEDPIGKQLKFGFPPGDGGSDREIVGIVGDVRDVSLGQEPGPMMYVPYAQAPFWGAGVLVKSSLDPASVVSSIREHVRQLDKDLPVTDIATMPDVLSDSVAEPRFRTFLLCLFAAVALILAATGILGVISYSVSCRTNEIGIRVALGASQESILRMVLRETLLLTLAGLAVGIPCALLASRLVGHLLFGVSAGDPITLTAVAVVLAAIATIAGYIPARRAASVEPIVALRYE